MIDRYTTPELREIWSEKYKYEKWLSVELAVLEVRAELGEIQISIVKKIKKKAKFDPARIKEIEATTHHDVIAFLENIAESVGPLSSYVHLGLTSYDVVDTALSILMKEAGQIIYQELKELEAVLKRRAIEEKNTLTVGRTHGIHAEPTSLGLKFLVWYDETIHNQKRLETAISNISYGKISGACGNYAHILPKIEELTCKKLGLKPAPVSTQIIQRDRHAEYLSALAIIATSCEKFAQEVRHLQRTEINEFEEPFLKGQKGSSAMPHKKNPIICERICGLARVVRGNAISSLQNIPLWGERDISNSSPERIIIPDSTILTHYIIRKIKEVLTGLLILKDNLKKNLNLTNGVIFSGRILTELIKKGMPRKEAYEIIQICSFQVGKQKKHLKSLLLKEKVVKNLFSTREIENLFNPDYYLRNIDSVYKRFRL
ncbi:adenylosuccinate lyase [candidate division WOR-3 bacterium]|nr:adenylosuccinate lyase [candidate division WOR-3 bacterium]